MSTETISQAEQREGTILGHPKGLFVCFATEMWERFSFYGMKYLLLLYLTKYHLFTDANGLDVLGSYAGLVYAMPVIGGLLADRYLGMRKAVLFGGILLSLGHFGMAFEGFQAYIENGKIIQDTQSLQIFYFSLALIIMGVGFLKPNISTLVGQLYTKDDPRRDAGFTIFYMGINIGSASATLLCGWLGETYGWRYGFGAAGVGMLLGLITFTWGQQFLRGLAEPPDIKKLQQRSIIGLSIEHLIYLGSLAGLFLIWRLVQHNVIVHHTLNVVSLLVFLGLCWFLVKCDRIERNRMIVLMVLILSTVVFWALFEQSAASMTLYADRVVHREALGIEFTASQLGSLNAIFIILLAPIVAWIWMKLAIYKLEPSTPLKFSMGILLAGAGFIMLVIGARWPDATGKVALIWLILAYALHTLGELSLSPVGLSAVTKLSVPRIVGVMMGTWFLATAYSEMVAAQLSKIAAIDTAAGKVLDIAAALASYTELFTFLCYVGIGVGIALAILSPLLKKMTHGIN